MGLAGTSTSCDRHQCHRVDRNYSPRSISFAAYGRIVGVFKGLGYKFVTLDLEGFRSGSMNALLPISAIGRGTTEPSLITSEAT